MTGGEWAADRKMPDIDTDTALTFFSQRGLTFFKLLSNFATNKGIRAFFNFFEDPKPFLPSENKNILTQTS